MSADTAMNTTFSQAELERTRETKLLKAVKESGDKNAYSQLYSLMVPKLKGWLRGQGVDATDSENIVHEVMITVWTKPHLFDETKSAARTWIYTLVRNKMIDEFRSINRKRAGKKKLELLSDPDDAFNDDTENFSTTLNVSDMLEVLPKEQKQILQMLYNLGMSHREVADSLRLPIGTVKSRTRLAFQRLRKNI